MCRIWNVNIFKKMITGLKVLGLILNHILIYPQIFLFFDRNLFLDNILGVIMDELKWSKNCKHAVQLYGCQGD